jgi:predicted anti-sigma-YlaC factor YlaD
MRRPARRCGVGRFLPLLLVPVLPACSIRGMALSAVANGLSGTGDTFASDDDPELVRAAVPFGLKTYEALLAELPEHRGLLLASTRGFTQYAYAFVETDALLMEDEDPPGAREQTRRARNLYMRAKDYGLQALELEQAGTTEGLRRDPEAAAARLGRDHVELMYWTAAAWGAAIYSGMDDPGLVVDFPAVRALLERALELDPEWGDGALHEAMISLESVPAALGGSEERARWHFQRAVELSEGRKAGPYVALAGGLVVANQDREEFERLLESALAVDPDAAPSDRLANLIAQKRARHLLSRADELFF